MEPPQADRKARVSGSEPSQLIRYEAGRPLGC